MKNVGKSFACAIVVVGLVLVEPAESFAAANSGPHHAVGVGLTLSFSVGARPAFGIGGDLRYTLLIDEHRWEQTSYGTVGGFLQATALRGGAFRFAAGAHGGAIVDDWILNADGELGVTWRTGYRAANTPDVDFFPAKTTSETFDPGGWGLHLGFSPQFNLLLFEHGPVMRLCLGLSEQAKTELVMGWEFRALPVYFFTGTSGHWS